MSIQEKRRAAFEQQFQAPKDVFWNPELAQYAGGQFWWLQQERWLAWNAAMDSLVVELPYSEYMEYGYSAGLHDGIEECKKAIESAGVRVRQ